MLYLFIFALALLLGPINGLPFLHQIQPINVTQHDIQLGYKQIGDVVFELNSTMASKAWGINTASQRWTNNTLVYQFDASMSKPAQALFTRLTKMT